ncbi:hypothetical protein HPB51_009548 [Rhipicephalus microplus]|uniref:Proline dehydrogenase n=1 Tax=Rhipicephalus microplus TaxID=6941 RepID=A0A9J6F0B4_RHIMP|nr:hypothetical protein HPB51_009548 [Rhipicephalus microplus]
MSKFDGACLLRLGQRVLGRRLFRALMRNTFYGHFVGGQSASAIQPLLQRLRSFGVKAILDYSAEEDLSEQEAKEAEMAIRSEELKLNSFASISARRLRTLGACNGCAGGHLRQFQPSEQFADRRHPHVMARTYFYLNEAQCEKNMDTFLECIDAVAGVGAVRSRSHLSHSRADATLSLACRALDAAPAAAASSVCSVHRCDSSVREQ